MKTENYSMAAPSEGHLLQRIKKSVMAQIAVFLLLLTALPSASHAYFMVTLIPDANINMQDPWELEQTLPWPWFPHPSDAAYHSLDNHEEYYVTNSNVNVGDVFFYTSKGSTSWQDPVLYVGQFRGNEQWWDYDPIFQGMHYVGHMDVDPFEAHMVNRSIYRMGGAQLAHTIFPNLENWDKSMSAVTETYGDPVDTNMPLCTNVYVPPMTIAIVGSNIFYNLEPLPGSPLGNSYKDPFATLLDFTRSGEEEEEHYSFVEGSAPSLTYFHTNYIIDVSTGEAPYNDPRQIRWSGLYSNVLDSAYRTTTRASLQDFLTTNSLNTNSGIVVGSLLTYEVIEDHPVFTGTNAQDVADYVFQVHQQLGRIVKQTLLCSSDTNSDYPVISVANSPATLITPINTSATASNFSITEAALTGNIQITLTAENGTLWITTTSGLGSISGNHSSELVITGPLSNVNAALLSLHYQPNTNFSGSDVIRIIADDLGHNSSTIPHQTTAIISVLVNAGLSNGQFVNSTDFQFTIGGRNSTRWQVQASTDLVNWANIGTASITTGTTTFVDVDANTNQYRFYRALSGASYSDSLGFIKVTVSGRTNAGVDRFMLIANQLNNEAGSNTLQVLMPNVPDGTMIQKYNASSQEYSNPSTFFVTQEGNFWDPEGLTLNPGEGAMINNPTTTPFTVTFIGKVPVGQQNLTIYPGFNLVSSIVPQALELDQLAFPAVDGDLVYRFNPSAQGYDSPSMFFGSPDNIWDPIMPLQVGEAYLINSIVSTNRNWSRNFSVAP